MLQRLGLSAAKTTSKLKLGDGQVSRFAIVSAMYQTLINTLAEMRLHILTGKEGTKGEMVADDALLYIGP